MSTPKRIRPPQGMRLRRAGEIVRKSDLHYTFDFDRDRTAQPEQDHRWRTMDSWDRRYLVGTKHDGGTKVACRAKPSRAPKYPWRTMKVEYCFWVLDIFGKPRPVEELLKHVISMCCQWNAKFGRKRLFRATAAGNRVYVTRIK